jgi:hypothetical protein
MESAESKQMFKKKIKSAIGNERQMALSQEHPFWVLYLSHSGHASSFPGKMTSKLTFRAERVVDLSALSGYQPHAHY